MDKIFKTQRGKNLDVYVDDSIVKSKTEEEMIIDLQETFDNMRKYKMKLNPRKSRHEIMKLTGRMTALSRFISKSSERIMSFFKVLKGNKNFEWREEQSQTFRQLKEY